MLAYTARAGSRGGGGPATGAEGHRQDLRPPRPLAVWLLRRPLAYLRQRRGVTAAAVLRSPLREDLTLSPGPLSEGQPTWSIYDPARHRFVRLGWLDFEILSRWGLRAPDAILAAIAAETTLRPSTDDIVRFAKFARGAGLLQATTAAETAQMAAERAFERKSAASLAGAQLSLSCACGWSIPTAS